MKKTIAAVAAAAAIVFAGCQEYTFPTADEIGASVAEHQKEGPSAEDIGTSVAEQQEAAQNAQQLGQLNYGFVDQLDNYGTVAEDKKIQEWDQTDAAFTLTVNSAVSTSVPLPSSGYKWDGPKTGDIKLNNGYVTIKAKSENQQAEFTFTYTNANGKTAAGTLTVKTMYDAGEAGIADDNGYSGLKSRFEEYERLLQEGVTANTPIARWGQTDAAYTVTVTSGGYTAYLYRSFNFGSSYTQARIEWKPPVIPAGVTVTPSNNSSYSTYQLSTSATDVQTIDFEFRITNQSDTTQQISGKITVQLRFSLAEQETAALQALSNQLSNFLNNNSSYALTFWNDTPASGWGADNVKYTAQVSSQYSGDYYYIYLLSNPSLSFAAVTNNLSWSYTGTAITGIDTSYLSSRQLRIDNYNLPNAVNTIEIPFTYTFEANGDGAAQKTIRGFFEITVLRYQ